MDEHRRQPHQWRRAMIVMILLIIGSLLALALSLLAVQRGLLPPRNFTVAVGPVALSAVSPSIGHVCPPTPPDYTIWITVRLPGKAADVYPLVNFTINPSADECTCWCDR
jgi:hypothetical protein